MKSDHSVWAEVEGLQGCAHFFDGTVNSPAVGLTKHYLTLFITPIHAFTCHCYFSNCSHAALPVASELLAVAFGLVRYCSCGTYLRCSQRYFLADAAWKWKQAGAYCWVCDLSERRWVCAATGQLLRQVNCLLPAQTARPGITVSREDTLWQSPFQTSGFPRPPLSTLSGPQLFGHRWVASCQRLFQM